MQSFWAASARAALIPRNRGRIDSAQGAPSQRKLRLNRLDPGQSDRKVKPARMVVARSVLIAIPLNASA